MRESVDGLLVLDKPTGMTSRAAVDRALRWFPRGTKVGHTGTLDPLATGVLVLTFGKATRLGEYVQQMSKTYRAGVRLGARSDTDDADGVVVPVPGATAPDLSAVQPALHSFVGVIDQTPPAFSAAKVTGRRAYDLARSGEEVALEPRPVQIYRIDLLAYDWPNLELEVDCGKGTYIRSLARDLGERLGCGGYIQCLRRTRVGPFTAAMGLSLDSDPATAREQLLPVGQAVAELPLIEVREDAVRRLARGEAVPLPAGAKQGNLPDATEVAVRGPDNALVAVATVDATKHLLRPRKVLVG
jgi:tRNA pseudouridine55 synthase